MVGGIRKSDITLWAAVGTVWYLASFICVLLSLLSCTSRSISSIYNLELNLSDMVSNDTTLYNNSSSPHAAIYRVGGNGYCYGYMDSKKKTTIQGCSRLDNSGSFGFTFEEALGEEVLKSVQTPPGIHAYSSTFRNCGKAVWSLLLTSVIIMILIALYAISCLFTESGTTSSIWTSIIVYWLSRCSALLVFISAIISTATSCLYRNRFNEISSEFGVTAHIGSSGIGIIWPAAILAGVLTTSVAKICAYNVFVLSQQVEKEIDS